jgi:hypothetical protein
MRLSNIWCSLEEANESAYYKLYVLYNISATKVVLSRSSSRHGVSKQGK